MKIVSFHANDIFSYHEFNYENISSKLNVIIGPNNSGKTNLFRVLRLVKSVTDGGRPTDHNEIPNRARERGGFNVAVQITFDQDEIKLIEDFLSLSMQMHIRTDLRAALNIAGRMEPLKRTIDSSGLDGQTKMSLNERYLDFLSSCNRQFAQIFARILGAGIIEIIHDGSVARFSYRPQATSDIQPTVRFETSYIESAPKQGYMSIQEQLLTHLGKTMEEKAVSQITLAGLDQQGFNQELRRMVDIERFTLDSLKNYNCGVFDIETRKLQGGEIADLTRILEKFSMKPGSSSSYDLGWMIFKTVSNSLVFTTEFRSRPTGELGLESLALRGNEILKVPDLAVQLHCFKNGNKEDQKKFGEIKDTFEKLYPNLTFTVEEVLYSEPDSGEQKRVIAQIMIEDINQKTFVPIEYTGSGILETLYLLVYLLDFTEKVLLLDEPSSHLHPTKQKSFLASIEKSAVENQIFLITHSPYLIDSANLEHTVAFRMEEGETRIYRPSYSDFGEREQMIRWFELDPNIPAALFSNKVILVDGGEEERALPTWFKKSGTGLWSKNVSLFNTQGDSNFLSYRRIMKQWGVPTFIICDRKASPKLVELNSNEKCELDADDFGEYLEKAYPASYAEARKEFGSSKPIIAAYIAMRESPPIEIKKMLQGSLHSFLAT